MARSKSIHSRGERLFYNGMISEKAGGTNLKRGKFTARLCTDFCYVSIFSGMAPG